MRVIALVALVCSASASEIGSFASWSETYTAEAAKVGATALNENVLSVTEPAAGPDAKLWRWYRNVGADEQAKAKAVMDEAAPAADPSSAIMVANFKIKYDKAAGVAALKADGSNAGAGTKTMYEVLGETEPKTVASIPLWTSYRSFNAEVRDQVKKDIVRAPFIKLFAESIATGKKNAGMKTFATATAFVAGTQGSAAPADVLHGKETNLVFKAFHADDKAELNALLVPLLKAFQAKNV